jgi:hypothetical protein
MVEVGKIHGRTEEHLTPPELGFADQRSMGRQLRRSLQRFLLRVGRDAIGQKAITLSILAQAEHSRPKIISVLRTWDSRVQFQLKHTCLIHAGEKGGLVIGRGMDAGAMRARGVRKEKSRGVREAGASSRREKPLGMGPACCVRTGKIDASSVNLSGERGAGTTAGGGSREP